MTSMDRSQSNDRKVQQRKSNIKKLKQNLYKMSEENQRLKSTIASLQGGDKKDKGKTSQSNLQLDFVNEILEECEELKVFDL